MPDKPKAKKRNRNQTKDRVLQARIPEKLDEELRGRAEQLGLSVSTIVRNVLLHTFDLVEGVVTDSSQIARALTARATAPTDHDADTDVIGWQEVTLNKNGICEQCNAILPLGQRAAIGVPAGTRATLLCLQCLAALSSSADGPAALPAPEPDKKRPARTASPATKKTAR